MNNRFHVSSLFLQTEVFYEVKSVLSYKEAETGRRACRNAGQSADLTSNISG